MAPCRFTTLVITNASDLVTDPTMPPPTITWIDPTFSVFKGFCTFPVSRYLPWDFVIFQFLDTLRVQGIFSFFHVSKPRFTCLMGTLGPKSNFFSQYSRNFVLFRFLDTLTAVRMIHLLHGIRKVSRNMEKDKIPSIWQGRVIENGKCQETGETTKSLLEQNGGHWMTFYMFRFWAIYNLAGMFIVRIINFWDWENPPPSYWENYPHFAHGCSPNTAQGSY